MHIHRQLGHNKSRRRRGGGSGDDDAGDTSATALTPVLAHGARTNADTHHGFVAELGSERTLLRYSRAASKWLVGKKEVCHCRVLWPLGKLDVVVEQSTRGMNQVAAQVNQHQGRFRRRC